MRATPPRVEAAGVAVRVAVDATLGAGVTARSAGAGGDAVDVALVAGADLVADVLVVAGAAVVPARRRGPATTPVVGVAVGAAVAAALPPLAAVPAAPAFIPLWPPAPSDLPDPPDESGGVAGPVVPVMTSAAADFVAVTTVRVVSTTAFAESTFVLSALAFLISEPN
jgi:hypothetical protein